MSAFGDIFVLFATRTVRMVAYGTVGIILALYLNAVGLSNDQLGLLLTLTLLGDSVISLAVTRWADRVGRRFMLVSSCLLMILAGVVYGEVLRPSFAVLLVAATVGVLSPSGNEVGPFMALEQSILAELVGPTNRTHLFAWYNLVGYSMTAIGALAAGAALTWAQRVYDISELQGYRAVFLQYGISGGVLLLLFLLLTDKVERPECRRRRQRQLEEEGAEGKAAAGGGAATGRAVGASGTAVQGDEEAGLREPLLRTEAEVAETPRDTSPPPLEPPTRPGAGPGLVAAAVAAAGVPGGSTPGGPGLTGSAAAGGGGGGGGTPVESFLVTLDEVTEEGSERYGSEPDGGWQSQMGPAPPPGAIVGGGSGGGGSADGRRTIQARGKGAGPAATGAATAAAATAVGGAAAVGALGLSSRSQRIVVQLSVLFATDSFAGGLVTGTLLAYFFQTKYGVSTAYLGSLLFGANLLAAVSSLLSGYVAARIGLINTMVFTHLPSNLLMLAVPLMPTLRLATLMVFLRFSISQMDVAPRASYVAGVVRPDERTAAMGIVNIAKSIGASFGPLLTGWLAERGLFQWAFYLCGGLKIAYDLALLWSFSHVKPEH